MYKILLGSDCIKRITDNACIPKDSLNKDWQEYKKWIEEGNTPLPPDPIPTVVPESITRYQGKMHLLAIGEYDSIKEEVDLPTTPEAMRVGFYDAQEWRRDSAMIAAIAAKKGWPSKYVDDLFIAASAIK